MNTCDHCEAVRFRQAQISGGRPLTSAMHLPRKYYSAADSPGTFDSGPASCPCRCHDPWRMLQGLSYTNHGDNDNEPRTT